MNSFVLRHGPFVESAHDFRIYNANIVIMSCPSGVEPGYALLWDHSPYVHRVTRVRHLRGDTFAVIVSPALPIAA